MSEFLPVETRADLEALDQDEIVAGYLAGFSGETNEPGSDKSRGYWHGWRNAMADRGNIPQDVHMSRLIRDLYPNINPRLS